MFWPGAGIGEDPATGSAVAAFAGIIVRNDGLPDGEQSITIEQGYEMDRPSLINLLLDIRDSKLVWAKIGGDVVEFARGVISV